MGLSNRPRKQSLGRLQHQPRCSIVQNPHSATPRSTTPERVRNHSSGIFDVLPLCSCDASGLAMPLRHYLPNWGGTTDALTGG
jgi:hypothetical protein